MEKSLTRYKIIALAGLVLMGVSSFMSTLAATSVVSNIGSGLLLVSIGIMFYAFAHWQP